MNENPIHRNLFSTRSRSRHVDEWMLNLNTG